MYRANVIIFYITEALFLITSWHSDRIRAKTRLRASKEWIDLAEKTADLGIWSWDIARDRFQITEFGRSLYGFASATPINYQGFLMTLHPDDRQPTQLAIQQVLTEKNDYRHEYRVIRQDGSVRWIVTLYRGNFDDAGKPLQLLAASVDVTARKQMEQELKVQQQMLIHITRVTTMGELSGALAHELNQPLAAILCNAQAGQRFLAKTPPDWKELRAIMNDITEADRRASQVVSRLRVLFKKDEVVQQGLHINTLTEEVTKLLHSDLIAKQVSLTLHLADNLQCTIGDPVQLTQVLINLVMNATEAMTSSATGLRQLRICTSLSDTATLEVAVHDTGSGIAPQALEQIFDPFITSKPHSLGMGLTISRIIINAHGGRLWAINNPDRGATLRFTLPITQETSS
ncbi:ATP-binding protein [Candidatus Methylospira mobilis]|uniref:ATP-binding protein n=1 Tax=Candidatus Methylospira mobilis TaxID=1808979 RepID=UPI0028EE7288|nr:ATP-binding protein [Candidatus Methylospira mobilis]WNV03985.1 ATP-binding protein [Candidatus Methylospira mobilis]